MVARRAVFLQTTAQQKPDNIRDSNSLESLATACSDKNQLLQRERGISFERIVFEISSGNELAVLEHPNQEKYPGQRISMVQVDDYVYAVPFVETDTEIFLKTIIPSRKATRQYRSNT